MYEVDIKASSLVPSGTPITVAAQQDNASSVFTQGQRFDIIERRQSRETHLTPNCSISSVIVRDRLYQMLFHLQEKSSNTTYFLQVLIFQLFQQEHQWSKHWVGTRRAFCKKFRSNQEGLDGAKQSSLK